MKITPHAKQRITEMGLDLDEVMAVVRDPEMDTPSQIVAGRRTLFGGRLMVVVEGRPEPHADRMVSVLWRDHERQRQREEGPHQQYQALDSAPRA